MASSDLELPFLEHLEELRWRIIRSVSAIVVCSIPCGIYWRQIYDVMMIYPLRFANPKPHLIVTSPIEAVVLSVKIAMAGGAILAAPFVFYQVWRFAAPGLYKHEKTVVLPTVIFSTFFFLLGVGFCYTLLPYLVKFLTAFGGARMDPYYRISEYLSFLLQLCLAFGVVFELPVVSFVLTRLGIITPRFLVRNYRYAIVAIFVVAAILTPPDVFSQLVMAVPLLALYGLSILVSYMVARKRA